MDSVKKVINNIFLFAIILCFTLAVCLVFAQAASIITLNGELAATAKNIISKPASLVGGAACILGFFSSYIKQSKS